LTNCLNLRTLTYRCGHAGWSAVYVGGTAIYRPSGEEIDAKRSWHYHSEVPLFHSGSDYSAILSDVSPVVSASAVYALSQITHSVDGVAAVIEAGPLKRLDQLVESPSAGVRRWTCVMLGNLARHQPSSAGTFGSISCGELVKLLRFVTEIQGNQKMNVSSSRDVDSEVICSGAYALSVIARSPDGALAFVQAGALGILDTLLQHPHAGVRQYTCQLLWSLAHFEHSVNAFLDANSCAGLVSLVRCACGLSRCDRD
jgi:hypothetical protein